jgi:hypothetical protein
VPRHASEEPQIPERTASLQSSHINLVRALPPSDLLYCISKARDLNSSKGCSVYVCMSEPSVVPGWSYVTRHFVALEDCNKRNKNLLRNKKKKSRRVNYDYITVFWDVKPCNLLRINVSEEFAAYSFICCNKRQHDSPKVWFNLSWYQFQL